MIKQCKKYLRLYSKDTERGNTKWIEELYDEIKKDYKLRMKSEEFNLDYEVIRINRKLSKYTNTHNEGVFASFSISTAVAIISFYFSKYFIEISGNQTLDSILTFLTVSLFMYLMYIGPLKEIIDLRDRNFVDYISLMVLNDLEQESIKKID